MSLARRYFPAREELRNVSFRRGEGRRLVRACVAGLVMGVNTGCYVYTPAATPGRGTRVLLELNDRGRVGLGESVGSAAKSIEGNLRTDPDSVFALQVVSVQYLNGQTNRWTGEAVSVSRDYVGSLRERQFSRTRTFLAAAGIVGGAMVLIATRGLLGSGNTGELPKPPEPGPEQ